MPQPETVKIAVITGSRADYGLLYSVMRKIQQHQSFKLNLIVTGMHLSPDFGNTYKHIEADGFHIDYKVEMLLSGDTRQSITHSIGLGVIGFSYALQYMAPHIVLLLGDRYEIFAATQAALIANIPVAHIAGGDITEGAYDDAMRHSISKMSHLHFATNSQAVDRLVQMGENPQHVFNVGSPGIDTLIGTPLLDVDAIKKKFPGSYKNQNCLVTFHPTTLETQSIESQCDELFSALDSMLVKDWGIFLSFANADHGGRYINTRIKQYVEINPLVIAQPSMGHQLYLSLMNSVDVVIGNSSSGLYEAPSYKTPTVNIGDRQKGRLQPNSVVNCAIDKTEILKAIDQALRLDCRNVINPYGDGTASTRIIKILETYCNDKSLTSLIYKHFYAYGEPL